MKNIILTILVLLCAVTINAQVFNVYGDDAIVASYVNTAENHFKIVADKSETLNVYLNDSLITSYVNSDVKYRFTMQSSRDDDNLLAGEFSVSATKKVRFTNGNLYYSYDTNKFSLEDNQTDFPKDEYFNHIGHFYWTSLADYNSGNSAYMPYSHNYEYSSQSISDKCWCGEENPLTVDGTSDLYVLTCGDWDNVIGEWDYLMEMRPNASKLYKSRVTINGVANCLIIAPDSYKKEIKTSYTAKDWMIAESEGVVCLPQAGYRVNNAVDFKTGISPYYSATPATSNYYGYGIVSYGGLICGASLRSYASSIRLVKTVK